MVEHKTCKLLLGPIVEGQTSYFQIVGIIQKKHDNSTTISIKNTVSS